MKAKPPSHPSTMSVREKEEFLNQLFATLDSLATLPEEDKLFLEKNLKWKSVQANEFLVKTGEPTQEIYFVARGIFKTCFEGAEGKIFTKGFIWEGQLAAALGSILLDKPSNTSIVALEDSLVVSLSSEILFRLYDHHPSWDRIGRKFVENLVIEKEIYQYQTMVLNIDERYEDFLKMFQPVLERIPLYEVASYMQITPVTLSNVRRKRLETKGSKE